jgi:hypothetical protein
MKVNIQINTGWPKVDDTASEVAEAGPQIGRPNPNKTGINGKRRVYNKHNRRSRSSQVH